MGAERKDSLQEIANFGGNQRWYTRCYAPASEAEVLDILTRHIDVTIRVTGSGHSWSDIGANADIALDLSALNSVTPIQTNGLDLVRVGAGCRIQDLLDRLHAATDRTLPTLGAIKKQTISGAISTGTHGSGRQSLSHFVASLRAVVFDPSTGHPVLREFTEGPELLAARCGLGCVGVILSVDLHTVPKYMVVETIRTYRSIEEIIAALPQIPCRISSCRRTAGYSRCLSASRSSAKRRRLARHCGHGSSGCSASSSLMFSFICLSSQVE